MKKILLRVTGMAAKISLGEFQQALRPGLAARKIKLA
jgi:hypothetical protein